MVQPIMRDPAFLAQPSAPATAADLPAAADLLETLMAHRDGCVGMAANMIGLHKRIIAVCSGPFQMAMINPEIIHSEGAMVNPEGCLSIPGRRCTVERPELVVVRAQDRHGEWFELEGEGFMAMACCHETDHLDGILYIDKMIKDVTDDYETEPADE